MTIIDRLNKHPLVKILGIASLAPFMWAILGVLLLVLTVILGALIDFWTEIALVWQVGLSLSGGVLLILVMLALVQSRKSAIRGWEASHYQINHSTFGHGMVLEVKGPPTTGRYSDIICRVKGPKKLLETAPRPNHAFHVRSATASGASWFFPSEFHPDLSQPIPRGLYRATWTGLRNRGVIGAERVTLARDWFLVWPEGVFRFSPPDDVF
jgi:hypothetical protein